MTQSDAPTAPQAHTYPYQNMKELLEGIRVRPTMFLGMKSIHYLKIFLDGWTLGRDVAGSLTEGDDVLDDFQIWIEKKYKIRSSHSWARIIDFYSENENRAFDTFFELYDAYTKLKTTGKLPNLERGR